MAQAQYAHLLARLRLKFYARTLTVKDVETLAGYFRQEEGGGSS
jgi:hypothetical protein